MTNLNELPNPKIFISYAWTNQEYIKKVLEIAEHLMADGIEVIIDKWSAEKGQDKYVFMEKMVSDSSIHHVLLMLNKEYKEKADTRKGGVGTEAQIISSELYNKTDQTKFIPVIMERDELGNEYAPAFLKNRFYVDLSDEVKFEENYEDLVRTIYNRPQYKKPKLGKPPAYLLEEKENDSDLVNCEKRLIYSIEKNDKKMNMNVINYLKVFTEELEACRLTPENYNLDENMGKACYEKYLAMLTYRDSFLSIIKNIILNNSSLFYSVFEIFKDIDQYYKPNNNRNSWYESEFDNFRLFVYDLILSILALLMKYDGYVFLKYALTHSFVRISDKIAYYREPLEQKIETIYDKIQWSKSISDYYKSITGQQYYSPSGEIIKQCISKEIIFSELIEADLLLFYFSYGTSTTWFLPILGCYSNLSDFTFFSKLAYKKELNKIMELFNTSHKEELQKKIAIPEEYNSQIRYYMVRIPNITEIVKFELWGTLI
ncbi:hypothetical protein FACS1894137_06710 [Spirochaetia bacterium]|nr:hypothetical protein FACS1894137_06640 [Spirochaetia bacterium]GHT84089.1 hypothetical protein FACS1894137_06710 [Spirochaetia bacterium]